MLIGIVAYILHEVASQRSKVLSLSMEHHKWTRQIQVGDRHGSQHTGLHLTHHRSAGHNSYPQVRLYGFFDRFSALKMHRDFERIASLAHALFDELACP